MNDPNCGFLKTGIQVLSAFFVIATTSLIALIGYNKKLENNESNEKQQVVEGVKVVENKYENVDDVIDDEVADSNGENPYEELQVGCQYASIKKSNLENNESNENDQVVEVVENKNENVDDVIADDVAGEGVTDDRNYDDVAEDNVSIDDVIDDRKHDDVVDGDIISVAVVEDQKRDDVDEGVTNDDVTTEPSAPTRDVIYEDLNDKNIYPELETCEVSAEQQK